MPLAIPFLAALPALLPAAMFLLPLFWRRHTQMFTITVPPEFLHGAAAARIRLIYMVAICALGIGGFACTFLAAAHSLASPLQGMFIAAPLVETAGLLVTWGWAWHKTLPHCLPHGVVRTASLTESQTGAGWWASTLSAWTPLAIAGAILQQRWLQIPERFPTHWGLDGQPNGWTARTAEGVYWPLALAAGLVLMMATMGWVLARYSTASSVPAVKRMTLNILRAVCWLLAVMFSATALLPLIHQPEHTMLWMIAGMVLAMVAIIAYAILTLVHDRNFDKLQAATQESAWKFGMFYFNPRDAALFVPKRLGYGFTLNFARPAAWLVIAGFLVLALTPLFFAHSSHTR